MRHALASLLFLVACVGDAPPPEQQDPDPDPGPPATGLKVTGKVKDYFTGLAIADAMVSTDGLQTVKSSTSVTDGSYAIQGVDPGSKVFLSATRNLYRPTRNLVVSVLDADITQDIYVMSIADIQRNYVSDGKPVTPGKAFVIAELQRNNGMPAVGVPLADVKLLDAADQPVLGVLGPYVMGATGDLVPTGPTLTELHNATVRVAFLDVPPGSFKLNVTVLNQQQQPQLITSTLAAVADGATVHKVGGMGMGGGGQVTNPRFATDVQPRLLKGAEAGIGCANCHTSNGQGAIMIVDGPAGATLDALKAKVGLIDLATPANSLLLTKPLYELAPPQNHPNATFLDLNDSDYKLIALWITQGALL